MSVSERLRAVVIVTIKISPSNAKMDVLQKNLNREVFYVEEFQQNNVLRTRFKTKILQPLSLADYVAKPFVCNNKSRRKRVEMLMHDVETNPGPISWENTAEEFGPIIVAIRTAYEYKKAAETHPEWVSFVEEAWQGVQHSWEDVKGSFGVPGSYGAIGLWLGFRINQTTIDLVAEFRDWIVATSTADQDAVRKCAHDFDEIVRIMILALEYPEMEEQTADPTDESNVLFRINIEGVPVEVTRIQDDPEEVPGLLNDEDEELSDEEIAQIEMRNFEEASTPPGDPEEGDYDDDTDDELEPLTREEMDRAEMAADPSIAVNALLSPYYTGVNGQPPLPRDKEFFRIKDMLQGVMNDGYMRLLAANLVRAMKIWQAVQVDNNMDYLELFAMIETTTQVKPDFTDIRFGRNDSACKIAEYLVFKMSTNLIADFCGQVCVGVCRYEHLHDLLGEGALAVDSVKTNADRLMAFAEKVYEVQFQYKEMGTISDMDEEMFSMPTFKADMGEDTRSFLDSLLEKGSGTVEGMMKRIEGLVKEITDVKLSFDFSKTFNSVLESKLFVALGDAKDKMLEWFKTPAGRFVGSFLFWLCLINTLIKYCGMKPFHAKMLCLALNISVMGDVTRIINGVVYTFEKVIELVMTLCSKENEEVFEDASEYVEETLDDYKKEAITIVLQFFMGQMLGNAFVTGNQKGLAEGVESFLVGSMVFDRYKKGLETTMDFLFKILGDFLNWFGEKMNIDYLKGTGVKFPHLEQISTDFREIVLDLKTGKRHYDFHTNEILTSYEHQLRGMLHRDISRVNPADRPYRDEANVLLNEIKKLTEKTSKSGCVGGGPRNEPISIVFVGPPGVGKSTVQEKLIYETTAYCLSEARLRAYKINRDNEVFTLHSDMGEYWEGYFRQFSVRVDDILQMKDAAGNPNPMVLAMIHMHNTSPFLPNFAALELKGSISFGSHMIWATDNSEKCSDNVLKSINYPAAFNRRWDLQYWISCKSEYCTEETKKLDPKKRVLRPEILLAALEGRLNQRDVNTFYPYRWSTGEIIGKEMTYYEVRDQIKERYFLKQRVGAAMLKDLNEGTDAAIAAREKELSEAKSAFEEEVFGDSIDGKIPNVEEVLFHAVDYKKWTWHQQKDYIKKKYVNMHPDKNPTGDPILDEELRKSFMEFKACADIWLTDSLRWKYEFVKNNPEAGGDVMIELIWEFKNRMATEIQEVNVAEQIQSWEELARYIKGEIKEGAYAENILPPNWVVNWFAERFQVPDSDVRNFFCWANWDENTPLGDYISLWKSYFREIKQSVYQGILNTIVAIKKSILDILTNRKVWIMAGTAITLAAAAWKIWSSGFEEQTERTIRVKDKAKVSKKPKAARLVKRDVPKKSGLEEEVFTMSQATSDMTNSIKNNLYWFSTTLDGRPLGFVQFVGGKFSTGVSHMFSKLEDDGYTHVWMHHVDGVTKATKVKLSDIVSGFCDTDKNEDSIYSNWESFPRDTSWNLLNHYMHESGDEADLVSRVHFGVLLVPEMVKKDGVWKVKQWNSVPAMANPVSSITYGSGVWHAGYAVSYNITTDKGMCGLPWIVNDNRSRRPFIAGYHAAGSKGRGLALCTNQETLRFMAKELGCPAPEVKEKIKKQAVAESKEETLYGCAKESTDVEPEETWNPVTETATPELPEGWRILKQVPFERVSTSSKLRKTVFFDKFTVSEKRPALLHPKIDYIETEGEMKEFLRDPWYNAKVPYGVKCRTYNREFINDSADYYAKMLHANSMPNYPWEPRVLETKEVCEGIEKFMKGVPRNTSAGYPWSKLSRKKYEFFGKEGDYKFDSAAWNKLDEKIKKDLHILILGGLPDWVYMLFLKDELRSKKKVDEALSRMVMGSPLDKTIIVCKYFKDFFRWLQDNRIFNGIALGINPHSVEWKIAGEYLTAIGENLIDGDFGNWDGYQPEEFDEGYKRVCESYYYNAKPEDTRVRSIIVDDTSHPRCLVTLGDKSYIAQVDEIMPSGDASTGHKNSVCNNLRSAYIRGHLLMKDLGFENGIDDYYHGCGLTMEEVFKDRYLALGDDHIASICEEHKHIMNQRQYAQAANELGFTYTDAQKGKDFIDGFRKLSEVSFLKRGWRKDPYFPGEVFAPLEIRVILEMLYWLEQGAPPGTLEAVVDIVGKELSAHGFDVWFEWGRKVYVASMELIGYKSLYLPFSGDKEMALTVWKRSVQAYKDIEDFETA